MEQQSQPLGLPKLPPMPSSASGAGSTTQPESSSTMKPAAEPMRSAPIGTKRLRQMVTSVASGGFALVMILGVGQVVLRDDLKPTTWLATFEAQTELSIMSQKLGHEPGKPVITEAQYQEAIAKAQRDGQAKAEIVFQQKLAVVQADKERVVGAYQTLYQRANMIAQAAIQLETVAQQFRQKLVEMSTGGKNAVIMIHDLACGAGIEESCETARRLRAGMIAEADSLTRGDVGNRVREMMSGIPDPASLIVHDDQQRHGVASLDR